MARPTLVMTKKWDMPRPGRGIHVSPPPRLGVRGLDTKVPAEFQQAPGAIDRLPLHIEGMAAPAKRLSNNVPGEFFVDANCIDCGTCRWMAPEVFDGDGEHSFVHRQPADKATRRAALQALVSCPTGSIGGGRTLDFAPIRGTFPRPVDGPVHHCGYHAAASFGAASWLILRSEGNVMVDCPRFSQSLVRRLEALGGVATMVLTHCDDVADHRRYAGYFGCRRVLHLADQTDATAGVETLVGGREPISLADDLLLIPVPGHTKGSMCLLYRGTYLFSGDHLAWDRPSGRLTAFREACWYDWNELVASMERLRALPFSWVLPGHGAPCHLSTAEMARRMADLMKRLRGREE